MPWRRRSLCTRSGAGGPSNTTCLGLAEGQQLPAAWPPAAMPSFRACFRSIIFCICTETGNVWTLLLGFVLSFLGILTTLRPHMYFTAPPSGEGGVWDVPPGSGALPQLLLALLHRLLSFRESLSDFLRTGLCKDCPTDYGELWPLALLLLLLLPTATAHLHPSSVFWAPLPSSWHGGTGSPLLSTGRQEQECSWGLA